VRAPRRVRPPVYAPAGPARRDVDRVPAGPAGRPGDHPALRRRPRGGPAADGPSPRAVLRRAPAVAGPPARQPRHAGTARPGPAAGWRGGQPLSSFARSTSTVSWLL